MSGDAAVTPTPARLVSLVPSLSHTLWSWGLAPRLVAVTDYCVAPVDGFPGAERIRGTKNPDVRAISALEPDLVVADQEENREIDVRRLREAGVAVHVTRVRTVADAADELAGLAEVLGVPTAGAQLVAELRAALAQVEPARPALRTFCPVWRDGADSARARRDPGQERWWAVGRDTFVGDLLRTTGFAVWPGDPDGRYPTVALDDVLAADCEVVLLPDEPYEFGEADHEPFAGQLIRHLDGAALTWWGPRTPAAIAELAALSRELRTELDGTGQ